MGDGLGDKRLELVAGEWGGECRKGLVGRASTELDLERCLASLESSSETLLWTLLKARLAGVFVP